MNQKEIIPHIRSAYLSYTDSEKKIADAILENPQQVVYSSISDVADKAGVAEATVLRFCRKNGYKGFYAFKLQLVNEMAMQNKEEAPAGEPVINQSVLAVRNVAEQAVKSIEETCRMIDSARLQAVADRILHSKGRIFFFGVGMSGNTAMDAMAKFLRLGFNAVAVPDGHMQLITASLLSEEDIAIGFSFSGSTKDTVDIMRAAKKRKAFTVCITHFLRSPIREYCDEMLLMGTEEGPYNGGSLAGKINQILVLDMLCYLIEKKDLEKAKKNSSESTEFIADKIY